MTQTALGTWIEDVVVGTGAEVQPGSQVTVEFTGWFPDGREFDSGVFSFVAGVGQVIVGFDDAVMNMRVGGVRKAVLPPQLAYGSRGTPDGTIPPNATLVFEIEVTDVQ
ncbi:MAG: FKBP-type peptidyl-prolyl cis-trans isomerase [Gemmatimonadetes bacterium]|nr:MAG: FKBP-type peptidyl-prolyl cis-trans isomerase [Gemmatimonadota bacterium]